MHEVTTAMQSVVNGWTELRSMVANMPDSEMFADIEIPLTFLERGHVITWGDDSEHFTPATFGFLRQLWFASKHILSKEDIREDVIGDEYGATDNAIWILAKNARQELKRVDFPYELETLYGKGYRLTAK